MLSFAVYGAWTMEQSFPLYPAHALTASFPACISWKGVPPVAEETLQTGGKRHSEWSAVGKGILLKSSVFSLQQCLLPCFICCAQHKWASLAYVFHKLSSTISIT